MKPWLWTALCVTLAATAMLAASPEPAEEVLPAQIRPPLQPAQEAAAWGVASKQPQAHLPGASVLAPHNAARRQPWPPASEEALAAWSAPPPSLPKGSATPTAGRNTGPSASLAKPVTAAASTGPPPAQLAVPAAPVPAFGYTLIGVLQQDGVYTALLDSKNKSLAARRDDRIDGQWQVVAVASEGLDLMWLPQQKPMRIGFGAP